MAKGRWYPTTTTLANGEAVTIAGRDQSGTVVTVPEVWNGSSGPSTVGYGETFLIGTADPAAIARVTWVRLGSVTHAFDSNQRFNELSFTRTTGAAGALPAVHPQCQERSIYRASDPHKVAQSLPPGISVGSKTVGCSGTRLRTKERSPAASPSLEAQTHFHAAAATVSTGVSVPCFLPSIIIASSRSRAER